MLFAEDLSPFFADFGDAGTLAGQPVTGLFTQAGQQIQLGGVATLVEDDSLLLPATSVPAGSTGATLVLARGTYRVRRIEKPDEALRLLLLEK